MIAGTTAKSCQIMLEAAYPVKCICEWASSQFGVELKPSEIEELSAEEIERIIKDKAKESAGNDISLSIGEYLEDYEDQSTWDIPGLCKWAMSAFSVSLSASKVKQMTPEQLEEQLIAAAHEQIEKKDCSPVAEPLKPDFAIRRLVEWIRTKFDIKLNVDELKG